MEKTVNAKFTQANLDAANAEVKNYMERCSALRTELADANQFNKQLKAQFADLKERLATADSENQRMRGYIQRVQEDDVVREELIQTGDPQGEQVLVPKRRSTGFHTPSPMSEMGGIDDRYANGYRDEPRRKPLHWIRYG